MAQLPPLYALDHAAPTSVTEEGDLELEDMQNLANLADEGMLVKMFESLSEDDLVRLSNAVADERCVGGRSGCFTSKEYNAVMSLLVELYNKTGTAEVPMGKVVSDPEAPAPPPGKRKCLARHAHFSHKISTINKQHAPCGPLHSYLLYSI